MDPGGHQRHMCGFLCIRDGLRLGILGFLLLGAVVSCKRGPSQRQIDEAEAVYVQCMREKGFDVSHVDLTPGKEEIDLEPHDRPLDEVSEATAECEARAEKVLNGHAPDPEGEPVISGKDLQNDVSSMAAAVDHGGVVALMVRDGESTLVAAGTANADGDPLTGETLFNIASVTKTYTATLIYLLEDDNLLDTHASLSTYVPDAGFGDDVKLDALLSHRSGIPDYASNPEYLSDILAEPERIFTAEELVEYARFEPAAPTGEKYSYSNTGYTLLGLVIEEVTGEPLADAFNTRLFVPLGLTATSLSEPPNFPPDLAQAWLDAENLGLDPDTALPVMPVPAALSGCQADCGVITTASELRIFFEALFDGSLVSESALQRMMETEPDAHDHGRGLDAYDLESGGRAYGHSGGGVGYAALVVHEPESDDTTIVLVNNDALDIQPLFAAYGN